MLVVGVGEKGSLALTQFGKWDFGARLTALRDRFHVDDLSSAHVYLRLPKGGKMDDIDEDTLEECAQLVKANSIQGTHRGMRGRIAGWAGQADNVKRILPSGKLKHTNMHCDLHSQATSRTT